MYPEAAEEVKGSGQEHSARRYELTHVFDCESTVLARLGGYGASTDRLGTPVMHNCMDEIAFGMLVGFD